VKRVMSRVEFGFGHKNVEKRVYHANIKGCFELQLSSM
jgi:hypothetical protein